VCRASHSPLLATKASEAAQAVFAAAAAAADEEAATTDPPPTLDALIRQGFGVDAARRELRKAKNRTCALQSRLRREKYTEFLEVKIRDLEREKAALEDDAATRASSRATATERGGAAADADGPAAPAPTPPAIPPLSAEGAVIALIAVATGTGGAAAREAVARRHVSMPF
jgi:hypothetical protein